jgi:excisionase family DNA binding protein
MGKLLSVDELVASKFGGHRSRGSVYNDVSAGRLPFVKIGTRLLFDEEEIDSWLAERRRESYELRLSRELRQKARAETGGRSAATLTTLSGQNKAILCHATEVAK